MSYKGHQGPQGPPGIPMTESEWLALLKEKPREADAMVAEALGHAALARAIREHQPLPCDATGRYASGDSWELFGQMWEALLASVPAGSTTAMMHNPSDEEGQCIGYRVSYTFEDDDKIFPWWGSWCKTPNAALALALLKAKGFIQEDGQ